MESVYEDCKTMFQQVINLEKELQLKRRWLIGLPLSKYEQSQLKGLQFEFKSDKIIPEYLLREDDAAWSVETSPWQVSYDNVKSFVEKVIGEHNTEIQYPVGKDKVGFFDSRCNIKRILSLVENLTNKGLCIFAETLTGGSIKFEETCKKMKHIIREHLPEVLGKQNDAYFLNIHKNLSSILNDPLNFRGDSEALGSQSYYAAVLNVLDGLEDLPTQTLSAMHRKLGGKEYVPRLQSPRTGWSRDKLIKSLRKTCMQLLSELKEGDDLQEPLMKAMEVAHLSLRLIHGCHYVSKFKQFSPQQIEIATSISQLKILKFPELKKLQFMLDPDGETSKRSLRAAIKALLTEYLFACSDMENIPESLQDCLAVIKKSSEAPYNTSAQKDIGVEVESILNVSAHIKQVVWDFVPEHDFDLEFMDAYMEELEESDDGEDIDRYSESDLDIESIGEINQSVSVPAAVIPKDDEYFLICNDEAEKQPGFVPSNFSAAENNSVCDGQTTSENHYLAVQPASDETSMVVYHTIGHLLVDIVHTEGYDLSAEDVSYLRGPSIENGRVQKT